LATRLKYRNRVEVAQKLMVNTIKILVNLVLCKQQKHTDLPTRPLKKKHYYAADDDANRNIGHAALIPIVAGAYLRRKENEAKDIW